MALTNCKECNKEVSTEAKVCPHCGAPVPKQGMGWFVKLIVGFTVIVGGLFVFLLILGALLPERANRQDVTTPSRAELGDTAARIFTTCELRVLGRQQAQGERITGAQATAIAKCVDEMGAAYVEGVKAGRR